MGLDVDWLRLGVTFFMSPWCRVVTLSFWSLLSSLPLFAVFSLRVYPVCKPVLPGHQFAFGLCSLGFPLPWNEMPLKGFCLPKKHYYYFINVIILASIFENGKKIKIKNQTDHF